MSFAKSRTGPGDGSYRELMRYTTRVFGLLAAVAVGGGLLLAPPASAATDTTTTVTSSVNPSTQGQAVTLTATVSGDAPTGSVTFSEGGTTLGTSPLNGGTATWATSSWAPGTHVVTASYVSDDTTKNNNSAGTMTQTVLAPPPPPAPVKPPRVHLRVSKVQASVGDKVVLHWRTKRADRVTASGAWNGAQKTRGSEAVRITERGKHVFKLTVANASGRKTDKVTVVATRKAKELGLAVTDELVMVGTEVDVTADGLAKGETYTVRLAGKPVLTGKADKRGDVARSFVVARTTKEGALELTITGSNPGRQGSAVLNVIRAKTLDVEVEHDEVKKKKDQTVTVTGLAPGEAVTVTYAGEKLTSGKADEDGTFTHTFAVGTKTGERTVKVVGSVASRVGEATFRVVGSDGTVGDGGGGDI